MSVSKEEQISAIITDWINTMDYLTGPDITPMLEAVSHNCIEGITLKTIREKVENSLYPSLNEFIYEFEKLLQHEKDILSSASNEDIASVENIEDISDDTLAKVFAVYKLFILGEYLSDWREKTCKRVDEDKVTIEKLYKAIMRGKSTGNVAKQRGRRFVEEKPQRISKRLSANQKKIDPESGEKETLRENIPEEKSSESDTRPSLEEMERLSLGEIEKTPTIVSQKIIGFEKDQRKARIQISPMKRKVQMGEASNQMVLKKCRNEERGPCSSGAFEMDVLRLERNKERSSNSYPIRRKRKRIRYSFRKSKRNVHKIKKVKQTYLHDCRDTQEPKEEVNNNNNNDNDKEDNNRIDSDDNENNNNNNNNDNEDNNRIDSDNNENNNNNNNSVNDIVDLTLATSSSSVEAEPELNENNNNNNTDLQIMETNKEPNECPLQPFTSLLSPVPNPVRPTASVSFHNTYIPVRAPDLVGSSYSRHSPFPSQHFPRYPYTTYPPLHPSPFDRFYVRHKVPSFTLFRHNFNPQRPQFHYRPQTPHSKPYY